VIWLAGLWEHWINPENEKPLLSFSILTRDAVGKSATIHDRMPVCITPNKAKQWLNPELQDRQRIEILMQDFPKQDYEIYPVTEKMNSPKFHGAECIQTIT